MIPGVEEVKGFEQIEATFLALRPGRVRNTSVTKQRAICSDLKATHKRTGTPLLWSLSVLTSTQ